MRNRKAIILFDIKIDCMTMDETVNTICESINNDQQIVHNSINANKVVLMQKNPILKQSLDDADMVSADGQAIVWASKWIGNPLPERVAGIDLMTNLLQKAKERGYKIYLFGAKQEIVKKTAEILAHDYSSEMIAGFRNGYFKKDEAEEIAESINESGAQILFVGIPSPQKENFIKSYRNLMPNIKLLMGVGGSFDVLSGSIQRAPVWIQKLGMEWFFRLIMEPAKMWKRYLIGNLKFLAILMNERRN